MHQSHLVACKIECGATLLLRIKTSKNTISFLFLIDSDKFPTTRPPPPFNMYQNRHKVNISHLLVYFSEKSLNYFYYAKLLVCIGIQHLRSINYQKKVIKYLLVDLLKLAGLVGNSTDVDYTWSCVSVIFSHFAYIFSSTPISLC